MMISCYDTAVLLLYPLHRIIFIVEYVSSCYLARKLIKLYTGKGGPIGHNYARCRRLAVQMLVLEKKKE